MSLDSERRMNMSESNQEKGNKIAEENKNLITEIEETMKEGLHARTKPDPNINPATPASVAQHIAAVHSQLKNNLIMQVLKSRLDGLDDKARENPKLLMKRINEYLGVRRLISTKAQDGSEYYSLDNKLILTIYPLEIEVNNGEELKEGSILFNSSWGYREEVVSEVDGEGVLAPKGNEDES